MPHGGLAEVELPQPVVEIMGTYLDSARMLGERTAELHLALAGDPENPAFAPETFTSHYVARPVPVDAQHRHPQPPRPAQAACRNLPPEVAELAQQVIDREPEIMDCYRGLLEQRLSAKRIRCHGDFDLTQALYTGRDIVLIDFEGDPGRTVSERTIKRSGLRDVAGMMRSFHYAAWAGLHDHVPARRHGNRDASSDFEPWARLWYRAISLEYLRAYHGDIELPTDRSRSPRRRSASCCPPICSTKPCRNSASELADRPDWLHVPLSGILSLLQVLDPPSAGKPEKP